MRDTGRISFLEGTIYDSSEIRENISRRKNRSWKQVQTEIRASRRKQLVSEDEVIRAAARAAHLEIGVMKRAKDSLLAQVKTHLLDERMVQFGEIGTISLETWSENPPTSRKKFELQLKLRPTQSLKKAVAQRERNRFL